MTAYLSVCAIYRDEASYMREWIEFHRLVGVERFFLYNNGSSDDHLEVLAPYVDDESVVLHDTPVPTAPQRPTYNECLTSHRDDTRWLAFIDIDEFLFSPTQRPVSELLRGFEEFPGVAVNRLDFGTSGHRTRPDGLVIENYVRRTNRPQLTNRVKNIVDPKRVIRSNGPHNFDFRNGLAVDELRRPVVGARTESTSISLLRLNHYFTKSEAELARKAAGPCVLRGGPRYGLTSHAQFMRSGERMNDESDETIMPFVPPLREALGDSSAVALHSRAPAAYNSRPT
jgi:hypothetical protein